MSKKVISEIKKNPTNFTVCNGCGSILRINCVVCPSCSAYNHDLSPKSVLRSLERIEKDGVGKNSVTEEDMQ